MVRGNRALSENKEPGEGAGFGRIEGYAGTGYPRAFVVRVVVVGRLFSMRESSSQAGQD
jgi:hypothetical protein